jgi:dihydrofolate reductase
MKVILAVVASIDGKTTKWSEQNIYTWTSAEDQKYFFSLIEENNAIIMGRKTYDAAKHLIKLSPQKLRIILTTSPEQYKDMNIPGELEFKNNPEAIIKELEEKGYTQVLLVSGAQVTTAFLQNHLVDEIWLTIEPKIFGQGNPLLQEEMDVDLQLKSIKQLNKQGTLLIKYNVL